MKCLFVFLTVIVSVPSFSQHNIINWKIIHPIKKDTLLAGTHGSVQEKLIEKGELPNPFYGENESLFTWIENYEWEFVSTFQIDEQQLEYHFIELNFPNIDTYAKIYLNNQLILEAENYFRPYRVQIKQHLFLGKNEIKAIFTPPVYHHQKEKTTRYPAPNDVGKIEVAPLTRKPQYQFGWDWALRMNTLGFMKPVEVDFYNKNRIILKKIETKSIENEKANLEIQTKFAIHSSEKIKLISELFGEFDDLKLKDGILKINTEIQNPTLWYPRGHGDQFMYEDKWIFESSDGTLIDSTTVKFGIRTSKLIQEQDKTGTSFYFKINKRPIFCKGANYIPQDVFPSKISDESIHQLVADMKSSNFNMIRVWGGGFYQDDVFYEACDKAGIMVWQDLMFACAMYPGNKKFLNNVKQELEYQIPKIAAHPSVVYFNGNNEVDVAWKHWGFQIRYLIGLKMQRQIETDYKKLFHELAPKIINENSFLPYVHTSPISNWGKSDGFDHGTMHYWGVWHGKDPIEDFGFKSGRFNAEYGFQSFPEYSSLLSFSEVSDWDLKSKIMKHHQKSYVGNDMIRKHSENLFGKASDFEEFVYFSQLTQAKAVGIAISSHRIDAPRCMGTLYWQMNDCWPAPTWSSIDYYKNWKALQYRVRADFEDFGVIEKTEKIGREKYFLISDKNESFESKLGYRIYDLKGKKIHEEKKSIWIQGNHLQEICLECQNDTFFNINYVIEFEWETGKQDQKKRTFSHLPIGYAKSEKKDIQLSLKNINSNDNTAIIEIRNQKFLNDFWIYSTKKGILFEDNFLILLPGTHEVNIKFEEIPDLNDFDFKWR
jgi:beta-mannosidase